MSSPLARGRIVWVELLDPQGRNPKVRPAVVLTPTAEISPDGAVLVAAITSDVGTAPRAVAVELPWHRDGHPRTKLRERSEAVCTWLERVPVSAVRGVGGTVPDDRLLRVLAIVASQDPNPLSSPPEPPAAAPAPPPPPTDPG